MGGIAWTDADNRMLQDAWIRGDSSSELSLLIGRTEDAIRNQAIRLELLHKRTRIGLSVQHNFFSTLNPVSAYYLGLIAADGNVFDNRLRLSLHEDDCSLVEKLRDLVSPLSAISFARRETKKGLKRSAGVCIVSTKIVSDLRRYGIVPRKTHILRWPRALPKKLIKYFILGYFDGDGSLSYCKRDKSNVWSLAGTRKFLTSVKHIIQSEIGVSANGPYARKDCDTCSIVVYKKVDIDIVDMWLHSTPSIGLARKTTIYN